MYMEKKRQAEMAKRKGLTKRTFAQFFLMLLAAVAAAGIVYWLETSGEFSVTRFYSMGIPTWVPTWGLLVGFGFVIMIAIQFLIGIGFVIGSPAGRERQGQATAHSKTIDFTDSSFDDY